MGQGDDDCAGAAVIGAGAGAGAAAVAGFGRAAAGFLVATGFLAGFFAGGGPPGVSSTATGFGRNRVGSPMTVIGSSRSDSG